MKSSQLTIGLLGLVLSIGLASAAHAGTNLISNGDFTNVSGVEGSFNGFPVYSTAADWTVSNDVVFTGAEANGVLCATFNGGDQEVPPGGDVVSQSFATQAGTKYIVSYDFGAFGNPTLQQLGANVYDSSSNLIGNKTVGQFGNGGGGANLDLHFFTFTADSSTTTLSFNDIGSTTSSVDGNLTNVSVQAVPEASTIVLFVALLLGSGLAVRRSKAAKQAAA